VGVVVVQLQGMVVGGSGEVMVQLEGMGLLMGPPARGWGGRVIGEGVDRVVKRVRARRAGRVKMECMMVEWWSGWT